MFCFQSGFLDTKIPPLILVFIFAGFMWLVHLWNIPYFAAPHSVAFLQNMMVMIMSLVGCLLPILGVISFRKANTTVDPRDPSRSAQLVVSGVYRITRNPMYLGFLCWLIAWGIYLNHGLALLLAFLFIPYMNRFQIQPEEAFLQQLFAKHYQDYCQRVRRWL